MRKSYCSLKRDTIQWVGIELTLLIVERGAVMMRNSGKLKLSNGVVSMFIERSAFHDQ